MELNKDLLIFLNSLLDFPPIEIIALTFGDAPIFFLPIFLITAWFYYTFKNKNLENKKNLLFIFYSCVIAIIINLIIKQFVSIDRPETVLEGVGKLLLKHIPDASFPSDHSAVSTAFLLSLFYTNYKKIGYLFLIFTILMCTSRIILGVHWPFDILAGILVGVLSAIISFKVLKGNKYVDIFNKFILKLANYLKL